MKQGIVTIAALTAVISMAEIAGNYNSWFGYLAGESARGDKVTAFGSGAAGCSTNDNRSVFIGVASGRRSNGIEDSVAIGYRALDGAQSGSNVVAIGANAFRSGTMLYDATDLNGQFVAEGLRRTFYITPDPSDTFDTAPIAHSNGVTVLRGVVYANGSTNGVWSGGGYRMTEQYDLYVDCSMTGDGNGTLDRPFRTIDEAVTAAREGDSICVMPGTYAWPTSFSNTLAHTISQGYDVSNKYVRIVSYVGRDKTFIRGTNGVTDVLHGNAFTEFPVIDGFTITGAGLDTRSETNGRMIGAFSAMDFRNCRIVMTNDYSTRSYLVTPITFCGVSNCIVEAYVAGNGTTGTYEMDFTNMSEYRDSEIHIETLAGKSPLSSGKNSSFVNCFVSGDRFMRTILRSYSSGTTFSGGAVCFSNSTMVVGSVQVSNYGSAKLGGSLFIGPCLGSTSETDFRACQTNDVTIGSDLRPPVESPYRLWGYKADADRALVKSAMRWYYDEVRPNETRLVTTNGTVHVYSGATDLGTLTLGN